MSQIIKLESSQHIKSLKNKFKNDLISLFYNKQFFYLNLGYGIGIGVFNALVTLINQWTSAHEYSSSDASLFAGLLVLFGILGAIVAGFILESTKKFKLNLKAYKLKIFTVLSRESATCL